MSVTIKAKLPGQVVISLESIPPKNLFFGFEKTKRAVVNALNLICKCISKRIYIYVNLSEEGFDSLRENQNFSLFHSTDGNLKP